MIGFWFSLLYSLWVGRLEVGGAFLREDCLYYFFLYLQLECIEQLGLVFGGGLLCGGWRGLGRRLRGAVAEGCEEVQWKH